jgi:hypothetical protein
MIDPDKSPEPGESQFKNVSQADVQNVQAEAVRMHQASAESIEADDVAMQQSAVAGLKAVYVSVHQSALAAVESTEVLSEQSLVGMVQAEKASLSGITGVAVANIAEVRHAMAGIVAGTEVHVDDSRTVFLIGRNVHGNVTTLMDTRSALIGGLVAGLFSGMMLLLGRMLFGRK